MSRKIKFRVWCKNKNEWEKNNCQITLDGTIFDIDNRMVLRPDSHILCRYTGLLDKNGKEIYEGDILYYDGEKCKHCNSPIYDSKGNYDVIWDNKLYGWDCIKKEDGNTLIPDMWNELEVIGNIHEGIK